MQSTHGRVRIGEWGAKGFDAERYGNRCGGEIGLFFAIKRCTFVLLHNGNGWFIDPPYLSQHGETDPGLK